MSSGCTGRQSPAGISLSSDVSGNSAETGQKETNSLKLEGVKKLWGKEGYLPKKEHKAGNNPELQPVAQDSTLVENVDQMMTKKDQSQAFHHSEEEAEKQRLASTLFVGLGSESAVSLLGKTDTVSHKFRRKSKVNDVKNREVTSAHDVNCSSFNPLSNAPYEDNDHLNNFQDKGDTGLKQCSLGSEFLESGLKSESLTELHLAENLSACSLSPPSLFEDNSMEIFHPPHPTLSSFANEISLTSSLLEELNEHVHSDLVELCNNEMLKVSSCKIWKDDCLLLVWLVANKSSLELKSMNLEITPTENFKILEHPGFCFPVIEAESTKSIQQRVQMEKPFTEEALSGFIKYQVEEDPHIQLEFSVTLSLLDFIRPMKICTEDFGKLWLSFANDVKQNVKMSDSQANLPFALKILQQRLRLHIVDIIGNEGILACHLLPSVPCLLHLRVHEGTVALWFRSSCSSLPDYLLYQCQKVMEEC